MWTPTTRAQHSRAGLRYGSDLTDTEWAVLEPLLPVPCRCGRPWRWPLREIMNAIFYVLRCSCPWRSLPTDLPPWRAAYRWFARLRDAGTWEALNFALVAADRERSGRGAGPSAAVMDSQSVRTTEAGGPRGYDAGKKVWGRKRHALTDTGGRALVLHAHPASVQDRDGAVPLLEDARRLYPLHRARLRRRRLQCQARRRGDPDRRRDRAQEGGPNRLRRPATALGDRTHLRLARPQSPPRPRLRSHHRFRDRLPLRRVRPAAHPQARPLHVSSETDT